jgi:hypothetical protein
MEIIAALLHCHRNQKQFFQLINKPDNFHVFGKNC